MDRPDRPDDLREIDLKPFRISSRDFIDLIRASARPEMAFRLEVTDYAGKPRITYDKIDDLEEGGAFVESPLTLTLASIRLEVNDAIPKSQLTFAEEHRHLAESLKLKLESFPPWREHFYVGIFFFFLFFWILSPAIDWYFWTLSWPIWLKILVGLIAFLFLAFWDLRRRGTYIFFDPRDHATKMSIEKYKVAAISVAVGIVIGFFFRALGLK
ncbi:MAG: hypothetical protein HUJ27_17035 [Rhodobacteraceae bacterium]|nr:hypothetical protein [Paracoccaceae bacterium]